MSNEYFNPASVPAPNAPGSSAVMRAEIARIAAAFDLMPVMAGSQGEFVVVDPTGTRLVASGFSFPDLVSVNGAQTLTNKTFAWADNTWSGFGTGATKNAGTGAGEVLLLAENAKLPVLDASNLTNINPAAITNAVVAFGINLKADANNAILTGAPVAPTPSSGDNSARISTTAFVQDAVAAAGGATPSNSNPLMNGVVSPGAGTQVSRHDHVHPTDTSRAPASAATAAGTSFSPAAGVVATNVQVAIEEVVSDVDVKLAVMAPINSPTFTGAPKAPTPVISSNDTSVATTAFAQALVAQQPAGMQPSNSTPLMNGVAAPGTGVEGSRHDHVHPTDTSRAPASAATAAGTSFTPTGTLSATDVQGAIVELLGETATAAQGAKADTALQPAAIGTSVQATLVSGTNIKTINGESVLGSGNVVTLTPDSELDASKLATGTVPTARLGSGTANNTTFLRGDGTWGTTASLWEKISEASISSSVAFIDLTLDAALYSEFKLVIEDVSVTGDPARLMARPYYGAQQFDAQSTYFTQGACAPGTATPAAISAVQITGMNAAPAGTVEIIGTAHVSGGAAGSVGGSSCVDIYAGPTSKPAGIAFSVRSAYRNQGGQPCSIAAQVAFSWGGSTRQLAGVRLQWFYISGTTALNFQAAGNYKLYGLRRAA